MLKEPRVGSGAGSAQVPAPDPSRPSSSRTVRWRRFALTFLATQFRMALVAREANLRGASQVQSHFQRSGVPMWGSRAEQVAQTAAKFSADQLRRGLTLIFEADRDLRSARPDDRTIVENFVVRLCA